MIGFESSRRRREICIRSALGARPHVLQTMVLRDTLRLVVLGTGGGLVIAYWAARCLLSLLFEVDARDPRIVIGAAAALGATAVSAAWLPARRAARTDPASVLRAA